MNDKVKAYEQILSVMDKYSELLENEDVINAVKLDMNRLKVSDTFGVPLHSRFAGHNSYSVVNSYDDWTRVALFGKGSISWSDDGRQPEDEWLFRISFTCGAYTFGDSYPEDTFNKFFDELKSYSPDYTDTRNHSLYFSEGKSKAVYDAFWSIFKKHKDLVAHEVKEKRKRELEQELARLNGSE